MLVLPSHEAALGCSPDVSTESLGRVSWPDLMAQLVSDRALKSSGKVAAHCEMHLGSAGRWLRSGSGAQALAKVFFGTRCRAS